MTPCSIKPEFRDISDVHNAQNKYLQLGQKIF